MQPSLIAQNDQDQLVGRSLHRYRAGIFAAIFMAAVVRGWRTRQRKPRARTAARAFASELAVGKKVEGELRKAAYADSLTSLPNRAAFLEHASEAIARVAEGSNRYAVFFIDLDRFNMVNDTLGHFAGDELLKMIAVRLRSELPKEAFVARLGGDEYLVVAETTMADAGIFADQILASLYEPILLGGRAVYTNASIGIVPLDAGWGCPRSLREPTLRCTRPRFAGADATRSSTRRCARKSRAMPTSTTTCAPRSNAANSCPTTSRS